MKALNDLITSLSLYPIKYLNELYLPYFSFLETSILLTSILFILNIFFVFVLKVAYFYFFVVEVYVIFIHSDIQRRKQVKIFYNNYCIYALAIYFYCMLIDMISKCIYLY